MARVKDRDTLVSADDRRPRAVGQGRFEGLISQDAAKRPAGAASRPTRPAAALIDGAQRTASRGFAALADQIGRAAEGIAARAGGSLAAVPGSVDLPGLVGQLRGAGDSAYLRVTPEGKVEASFRKVAEAGVKGQLGSDIRVTRESDAADSTYLVRYDKHALAAGMVGVGVPGRGTALGLDARAKGEVGAQSFDAVELRFATRAEAVRAAEILQRLQVADMVDDGPGLAISSNPVVRGVSGMPGSSAGTGTGLTGGGNPLGNPLVGDGAPGGLARHLAGVSRDDLAFLGANVTAYESTLGTRARLTGELRGKLGPLTGAFEGRLDGTERITRRVELPTATEDGRMTYSISGGMRLSDKEKLQRRQDGIFDPSRVFPGRTNGFLQFSAENRQELGAATLTGSVSYRLPAGQDPTRSVGGRPLVEADVLAGGTDLDLEQVSLRAVTEWRTESLADPSRGDSLRLTETMTLRDPARLDAAARQLFAGDWRAAAQAVGATVDVQLEDVRRSGFATQPALRVGIDGLATVEGSVILEGGIDDVVGSRRIRYQGGVPTPGPAQPAPVPVPGPVDDGRTLVVIPYVGVHVRAAPGGASNGVAQNGTFLRATGERQADAAGRTWVRVTGSDLRDRAVEGWVAADNLQAHDAARGAMDETGRTNPSLEHTRHAAVTVQRDDTLWDIARNLGVDPEALIALNRDHLINPSLIFAGDTVYLPGTAQGPEVAAPLPPPPAPAPQAAPGSAPTASSDAPSIVREATGTAPDSVSPPASPEKRAPETSSVSPSGPDAAVSGPGIAVAPGAGPRDRAALDAILTRYQVAPDGMVEWRPRAAPPGSETVARWLGDAVDFLTGGDDGRELADRVDRAVRLTLPRAEAANLDRLAGADQLRWLALSQDTSDRALVAFDGQRPAGMNPMRWQNDGHVDAYRHALWNARMTKAFGADWTAAYATSHEMIAGNPAAREAMDLYNNEVGQRIAVENPQASDAELARLVRDALDRGEMLVIDAGGALQWSDAVAVGQHGSARAGELPGNPDLQAVPQETAS